LLIGYAITNDLKVISAKTGTTDTELQQIHARELSLNIVFVVINRLYLRNDVLIMVTTIITVFWDVTSYIFTVLVYKLFYDALSVFQAMRH
jgi:hypothetical protein